MEKSSYSEISLNSRSQYYCNKPEYKPTYLIELIVNKKEFNLKKPLEFDVNATSFNGRWRKKSFI